MKRNFNNLLYDSEALKAWKKRFFFLMKRKREELEFCFRGAVKRVKM